MERGLLESKNGAVVKSSGCSFRGPGFNSQYPYGSSQLSITQVSGNLALTWHIDTHIGRTHPHIK